MRNHVYLTFQGEKVIISTIEGATLVLDEDQALELWRKLGEAFPPVAAQPDVTLAPTDCPRCAKE